MSVVKSVSAHPQDTTYDEGIKLFMPTGMPKWTYFKVLGDNMAYGYTLEPVDGKYFAFKYRISRKKRVWTRIQTMTFTRAFAKKTDVTGVAAARERAMFWYIQRERHLAKRGTRPCK